MRRSRGARSANGGRTWSERQTPGTRGDWPEDFAWIDLGVPGHMSGPEDRAALARLLGMDADRPQGVQVAASPEYYREYIDRAEGRPPRLIATPYWD